MLFQLNQDILIFLNNLWNYKTVEIFVKIFADAPIFFLPIFLVYMWIYYTYKQKNDEKKHSLLFIFYSTIIWIFIALIIQHIIHIDRPENYIGNTGKLLLKHLPDASFPSDHATVSFAFLTSLFLFWYKKIWWIFLPFVIFMNLSRIIAWVHWPFDILVWATIWIFSSYITHKYLSKTKLIKNLNTFIIKTVKYIKL